ncbi:hypothetical protein CFP56_001349 [Quercus suber]|uniref:Uncharacterized protein n=1 Tax=Quercus suber TaxID=58331 RepID=A0AAW0LH85_QUESU
MNYGEGSQSMNKSFYSGVVPIFWLALDIIPQSLRTRPNIPVRSGFQNHEKDVSIQKTWIQKLSYMCKRVFSFTQHRLGKAQFSSKELSIIFVTLIGQHRQDSNIAFV